MAAAATVSKGERTRQRILEAAAVHFAAVGFEGGSVPEIARQVGVSHATLYQHFGRKEALFRAAVEADLAALFATVEHALDEVRDADALVAVLPMLAANSYRHPLAKRVIADVNADQQAALIDSPALIELEQRVVAAIERGQAAGGIRADIEPVRFAAGLVAVSLPMLVVALRMEGANYVPRVGGALTFLTDLLRPTEPQPSGETEERP